MREFEQMEMQFFVKPGTEDGVGMILEKNPFKWHYHLVLQTKYRYHDHIKISTLC